MSSSSYQSSEYAASKTRISMSTSQQEDEIMDQKAISANLKKIQIRLAAMFLAENLNATATASSTATKLTTTTTTDEEESKPISQESIKGSSVDGDGEGDDSSQLSNGLMMAPTAEKEEPAVLETTNSSATIEEVEMNPEGKDHLVGVSEKMEVEEDKVEAVVDKSPSLEQSDKKDELVAPEDETEDAMVTTTNSSATIEEKEVGMEPIMLGGDNEEASEKEEEEDKVEAVPKSPLVEQSDKKEEDDTIPTASSSSDDKPKSKVFDPDKIRARSPVEKPFLTYKHFSTLNTDIAKLKRSASAVESQEKMKRKEQEEKHDNVKQEEDGSSSSNRLMSEKDASFKDTAVGRQDGDEGMAKKELIVAPSPLATPPDDVVTRPETPIAKGKDEDEAAIEEFAASTLLAPLEGETTAEKEDGEDNDPKMEEAVASTLTATDSETAKPEKSVIASTPDGDTTKPETSVENDDDDGKAKDVVTSVLAPPDIETTKPETPVEDDENDDGDKAEEAIITALAAPGDETTKLPESNNDDDMNTEDLVASALEQLEQVETSLEADRESLVKNVSNLEETASAAVTAISAPPPAGAEEKPTTPSTPDTTMAAVAPPKVETSASSESTTAPTTKVPTSENLPHVTRKDDTWIWSDFPTYEEIVDQGGGVVEPATNIILSPSLPTDKKNSTAVRELQAPSSTATGGEEKKQTTGLKATTMAPTELVTEDEASVKTHDDMDDEEEAIAAAKVKKAKNNAEPIIPTKAEQRAARAAAIEKAREQPKSEDEEAALAARYGSLSLEEKAFEILADLGLIESDLDIELMEDE